MESPLAEVELHLVESIDDLWALKRWVGERRPVPLGVDTESSGLDPARHRIRLIQVGDLKQGWAVPYPLWGGGILELLYDYEEEITGHNMGFDWRFLKANAGLELPWHKLHDTMILGALDDPTRTKGLKQLSTMLVDKHATTGEKALHEGMTEQGWTWETVPYNFTPYWAYGAMDPVLTAHLWNQLHPRVMERSPEVYDLEMGVVRVCSKMMLKGMRIDHEYINASIEKLQKYALETREWLIKEHNVDSPMSAQQIARALVAMGETITAYTPTNQPQMTKEILDGFRTKSGIAGVSEFVDCVLNLRHAEKMISTYLENFLSMADSDGVVHPQIWTLQARTGRMSISEPALQTLPRDDKIVRGAFIPREGCALISIDASQIEMRLAAALSGDKGLIELFKEMDAGGADIYSGIATELFGEKIEKSDPRRQATKTLSYTKLYGGGVNKMAMGVKLPVSQVQVIHDAFNSRFPGLNKLASLIQQQAREMVMAGERPATFTTMGRYLPCDSGKEFALINYKIQSEAAEVLKKGLLNLEAGGFGDNLCLPIHDEILLEVPTEDADDALIEVNRILNESTEYAVPIPWEGKVMRERWAK